MANLGYLKTSYLYDKMMNDNKVEEGDGPEVFESVPQFDPYCKTLYCRNNDKEEPRMDREKMRDYILSLDCSDIGPYVYVESDPQSTMGRVLSSSLHRSTQDLRDFIKSDISAVCRRAFKKDDVLVYVEIQDEDDGYEEGIVFTDESIFYWTDSGSDLVEMKYGDITSVDFDETDIIIKHNDETESITLGDDAEEMKSPRHMYNFIMDIKEFLEEE
ncbi:hypothetical protein SAMN02910453_1719 [Lachnospiraceae bacterium A10]|nr:hypothetical protein SAMN02910453_1719 [Lachnospiraceae bacterium A10]